MNYQAGYGQYETWPTAGKTLHAGKGWFHPFGESHYYAIVGGCPEQEAFKQSELFTEYWMDVYDTSLFCIYRMADGDIYAYDGVFAVRGRGNVTVPCDSEFSRRDILVNVIVGGRGRYEGATGLMIGTGEGGGNSRKIDDELTLPEVLIKSMSGYIKIPVRD